MPDLARNPKLDPRPGDTLLGPYLGVKVTAVLIGMKNKVEKVHYVIGTNGVFDSKVVIKTLGQWRKIVAGEHVKAAW